MPYSRRGQVLNREFIISYTNFLWLDHHELNSPTRFTRGELRKPAKPVKDYFDQVSSRNEGLYRAYQSGGYSMKAIADAIGLDYSSASKVIKSHENSRFKI